jgi:hypothetical protein
MFVVGLSFSLGPTKGFVTRLNFGSAFLQASQLLFSFIPIYFPYLQYSAEETLLNFNHAQSFFQVPEIIGRLLLTHVCLFKILSP